jgi:hypothetical protein
MFGVVDAVFVMALPAMGYVKDLAVQRPRIL